MQKIQGDRLIVSASDLNDRLACQHLLHLNHELAMGRLDAEPAQSPTGELLGRKGDEHEDAYLLSLKDRGLEVVELEPPTSRTIEALEEAAESTVAAMRDAPEVIFQATFFDGDNRGHTDFLFRVDEPSDLGDFSYEVADTKLARSSKPYFIIQLCFYSELLGKVQGRAPERIHVILGDRERQSYRLTDFDAYFRQVRRSFDIDLKSGLPGSRPYPVSHCDICGWKELCERQLEETDHLSRVAGIRRDQVQSLENAGVATLAELADLQPGAVVEGLRPEALEKLRSQAELQMESGDGHPALRLLEPRPDRGFDQLPQPSGGDVFFDFEGDPLYGERGLEYLFGYVLVDGHEPSFQHIWAANPTEEKRAFEQFIDFVTDRLGRFPDLHVYHYASYEVSALKKLAGTHATRELELDDLLRGEVFVDLYKVVKESMRLGQPSYSIKRVEAYYRPDQDERETSVADGGDSIVQFEKWLESGDETIKEAILEYNEDDCVSTLECRDWLLERRAEATAEFGHEFSWFVGGQESSEEAKLEFEENAVLREALDAGVPESPADRSPVEQARWLMARLVDYHQREARPAWWAYFDRLDFAEPGQWIEDSESIGGLYRDPETPARSENSSLVHRMLFPPQESKLGSGKRHHDPATAQGAGEMVGIDLAQGWLDLKRGPSLADVPLPRSLVQAGPYPTPEQRGAIRRLAGVVVEHGLGEEGGYRASRDILIGRPPRIEGLADDESLIDEEGGLDQLVNLARRMDETYLFIQGPPGAGKTYSGGYLIASLIEDGHKVGVTANSHKAINNLLASAERFAVEMGISFRGLKKTSGPGSAFESAFMASMIGNSRSNEDLSAPGVSLTGGTAWHYCREDTAQLDYLFIDEAGQVSLADALAMGTAARNIVLLGDPQQLAQVRQANHPDDSDASVLEHLLGSHQTVPEDRGVFRDKTWRMHPEVTEFVSELMYENRLFSVAGLEQQTVEAEGALNGVGLRWVPVEHEHRGQRSPEEAVVVSRLFDELADGSAACTDSDGNQRPLGVDDILVVSPYNAQVRCLADHLPEGARVGTVDKFQGQEAEVVIFSMATSSGEEIPRNVDFLFSRNRLNVAISRARCLAVLVSSPRLLEVEAKTIENMKLINALCRFAEVGETLVLDPRET